MALSALTIDMRELWKQVRLNAIRGAVEEVIGQLEGSHGGWPHEAAEPEAGPHHGVSPHRAALQVCCDELRTGCGMPPLHVVTGDPSVTLADPDWDACNADALERYRSQARVALREALGLTADGVR